MSSRFSALAPRPGARCKVHSEACEVSSQSQDEPVPNEPKLPALSLSLPRRLAIVHVETLRTPPEPHNASHVVFRHTSKLKPDKLFCCATPRNQPALARGSPSNVPGSASWMARYGPKQAKTGSDPEPMPSCNAQCVPKRMTPLLPPSPSPPNTLCILESSSEYCRAGATFQHLNQTFRVYLSTRIHFSRRRYNNTSVWKNLLGISGALLP